MKGIITFAILVSGLAIGMTEIQKRYNPLGTLVPSESIEQASLEIKAIVNK